MDSNERPESTTRRTPKQRRQRFVKERPPRESEDTPWRLFIAVPLPRPVTSFVANIIGDLEREPWPVRWSDPSNAHLTLHFLGDTPPEQAELLRMALGEVVTQHDAFDLRTADLGVFPAMKRPRVLWLGLWGPAHRLQTLRDDLGGLLENFDYELDEKPFHPHITLGRVRDARTNRVRDLPGAIRRRFEDAAQSGAVTHEKPISLPVREVVLVRSHLGKEGARYEVLEHYPLRTLEQPPSR